MSRTRIKICGITSAEDAAAAVAAGADALGVVLAPSPRRAKRTDVFAFVPPFVARVGVFVDPTLDEVARAVGIFGLNAIQLSGTESPEMCSSARAVTGLPVVKAFRVGADFDSSDIDEYRGSIAAFLLDAHVGDLAGGTGRTFDWSATGTLREWASVVLAGGLSPDNVAEAIAALHPYAVDVSSGVEASPGVKDHDLMRRFCAAVRDAEGERR